MIRPLSSHSADIANTKIASELPVTRAQPEVVVVQFEIHRAGTGLLTVGNLMHERATP
jgi:hypothetical protein